MIRALKSSFFRFYKTGALYLTVAGSVAFAFLVALYVYGSYFSIYAFKRPRFLDNSFVLMCLNALLYVMPFAIAVFCVLFTGTDLEYRSVNNKITTGISRIQIYCADLTFKDKTFIGIWLIFYINIHCGLMLITYEKQLLNEKFAGLAILATIVAVVPSVTAVCNALGRIGYSTISDKMKDRATVYGMLYDDELVSSSSIRVSRQMPTAFIILPQKDGTSKGTEG